jgi:hypothetical protein
MRNKLSVVLFTAILLVVFLSASIVFAADSKHPRTTFKLDRAPKYMIPFERPTGASVAAKPQVALRTGSSGGMFTWPTVAGETTYDYQHNGTMGRQLAVNQANKVVFFVWMAQENYTIPGDRHIRVQAFDGVANAGQGAYSLDPSGYNATTPDYSGYTSCDIGPNGEVSFACHTDPASGRYWSRRYYDGLPPAYIFYSEDCPQDMLPHDSWWRAEMECIWPQITVHYGDSAGVTDDVTYILTHVFEGTEDLILFRKINDGNFDHGQYIETVTDLSYTIVADPNSDTVYIVYTDDRGGLNPGDGGQNDLDVYYKMSTDQGVNWEAPVNVSNYTEDSLWRAYSDLSALVSSDGDLHIIAPVRELRDANTYETNKSRLVHWSKNHPKAAIIEEARYEVRRNNVLCDCGAWNMYLAKPSVSECEGKLYALFTKFGGNDPGALNDCSQQNNANGEIFIAGSDDWGVTWDTAWNLTKTRTPSCDSMECNSDHWSSMAAYGLAYASARDTLDIMYINDKDAGGIAQGEGTWCVNNVMHYRFGCRDIAHIPKISLEPTQYGDPIHTAPGVPLPVTLKINNIGNAVLNVSSIGINYINGNNWISIAGSFPVAVPTSDFEIINITMNAGGILTTPDPSGWDAEIVVNSDAPTSSVIVPVHLTVASDFNPVEGDTLRATTKKLTVFNTARLGGDNDGYSLDIPGDCDADLANPNGDMYLFDASPMISWKDGTTTKTFTTLFTQSFTEDGTFRPQSGLLITAEAGYNKAICTVTTSDSLFAVDVALYAPTDGNDFVIAQYEFRPWMTAKISDTSQVFIGFVADWDVPADENVRNGSGYNATSKAVWQYGGQTSTTDEGPPNSCPIIESNRFGGIVAMTAAPRGAWTAQNAPMQEGSGYNADSIFNRMSGTTYNMYVKPAAADSADTVIDLHTGITFAQVDLRAKTTYKYVVALVTTNAGKADFDAQVAAAYAWAEAKGIIPPQFICDCRPGDANGDGGKNVGDAVYLIAYVFKGGAAPTPYAKCSGDANGDCSANVGDAVYMIAYVFKGGAAPLTCDPWVTACGKPLR